MGSAKTDGDARHPSNRLDNANDLRRAKCAPVDLEARRKVGDAYAGALVVNQLGYHDGGIADVVRANFDLTFEEDVGEALLIGSGKQAAENGIAVKTRQAPPHDPRRWFKQCGRAAIADDREIESIVGHSRARPFAASKSRALRTCAGFLKTPASPGK